jgi:hypothetical protein
VLSFFSLAGLLRPLERAFPGEAVTALAVLLTVPFLVGGLGLLAGAAWARRTISTAAQGVLGLLVVGMGLAFLGYAGIAALSQYVSGVYGSALDRGLDAFQYVTFLARGHPRGATVVRGDRSPSVAAPVRARRGEPDQRRGVAGAGGALGGQWIGPVPDDVGHPWSGPSLPVAGYPIGFHRLP